MHANANRRTLTYGNAASALQYVIHLLQMYQQYALSVQQQLLASTKNLSKKKERPQRRALFVNLNYSDAKIICGRCPRFNV
jgi:hypothetical protein